MPVNQLVVCVLRVTRPQLPLSTGPAGQDWIEMSRTEESVLPYYSACSSAAWSPNLAGVFLWILSWPLPHTYSLCFSSVLRWLFLTARSDGGCPRVALFLAGQSRRRLPQNSFTFSVSFIALKKTRASVVSFCWSFLHGYVNSGAVYPLWPLVIGMFQLIDNKCKDEEANQIAGLVCTREP